MLFQNHKQWKCWQCSFAVITITEWKTEFIEYLGWTPTIIILFYFSQSSSEWYVLAMQCTILLFCLCFINILSQYQVMELSYGTLCQISFSYAEMDFTWYIFLSHAMNVIWYLTVTIVFLGGYFNTSKIILLIKITWQLVLYVARWLLCTILDS